MTVNNYIRYPFGILEVATIIRYTLDYFIDGAHPVDSYYSRKETLLQLTGPKSPFFNFCKQNGLGFVKNEKGEKVPASGQKAVNNMNALIDFCYSDNSHWLRVIDNKIIIDTSYYVRALELIIGVRETLNDIINNIIKNTPVHEMNSEFIQLIKDEERSSRAIELRVVSTQLNTTFFAFQNAVKDYIKRLTTPECPNPAKAPGFKMTNDPKVALYNSEMGRLFGYMNFLISHSQETDQEFISACEEMKR